MERFALFCGFWALILVPANLFLSPILLSYFPEPKNVKSLLGKVKRQSFTEQLLAYFAICLLSFWKIRAFHGYYPCGSNRAMPLHLPSNSCWQPC